MGCGRWNSLPSLAQHDTWQLEGRKSSDYSLRFPQSRISTLTNPKANILIDKGGHARLTDFGLTSIIPGEYPVASPQEAHITSTTMWVAPEILGGDPVSKEGDVFSFAMVTIEVCHERTLQWVFLSLPTSNRHSRAVLLSSTITQLPCMI